MAASTFEDLAHFLANAVHVIPPSWPPLDESEFHVNGTRAILKMTIEG